MDIFEQAAWSKLRFDTKKGSISAEEVCDIPKPELKEYARAINRKLKADTNDIFPEDDEDDTKKKDKSDQLRFDILMHIIDKKSAEEKTKKSEKDLKEKLDRLTLALAESEDKELKEKSPEELKEEIAKLLKELKG